MPRSDAPKPQSFGRFQVRGPLGRGGQGVVYLARDPELDREVAIKTLRRLRGGPEDLLREARTVGRLRHGNIVSVFDAGVQNGIPYVVYEYVPGQPLDEMLAAGPPPVPDALRWAVAILDALAYAHERGIVHRDIKPANILIADGEPRILDFGIAALKGSRTTTLQGVQGTVRYLAPEVLTDAPVTPSADLFSFGLVLYEMLTGTPAIPEPDQMAAMYHIAHKAVPPPSTLRAELSPDLDGIVEGALHKDAGARFASALEMKARLEAYLEPEASESVAARRQSTLNFLLRRMRQKSDFPAVSSHISAINQKTAAMDRASVDELANLVLKDYALTTKLLRLVNSSVYGGYGGRISTVSRAVVVLGFKQVRMAALSLLLFEHIADKPNAALLREIGGRAFFSGILSKRLAAGMPASDPEQAFVCSMFQTLGRYLTVYYFPEEYEEMQTAIANRGLDEDAAAVAVLGLTLPELGIGVAREWQLPAEIKESMRPMPADAPPRAPTDSTNALRVLASYANELTTALTVTEQGGQDAALRALRTRYGSALPVEPARLTQVVEEGLDDVAAYARAAGVDFRSTPFFRMAQQWVRKDGSEPGDEAADGAEPEAPGTPQNVLLSGIQDVSQALLESCPLNDILVMVLETIYRGLGFTRVLLLVRDGKHREMVTRFGLGRNIEAIHPRFRFPLAPGRDPFSLAVAEKQEAVWRPEASPGLVLPDWYRKLVSAATFAVYPIVIKDRTLGLIYADREERDRPITGSDQNYLNTLRNQATLAVRQRS